MHRHEEARARAIRALRDLSDASDAAACVIAGPPPASIRRLAVLPGAFNPPTLAHSALGEAALDQGFGAVFFALGTRTIDKPESGLALADRASLLAATIGKHPAFGLVLQNRGLYVEQAEAVGRLFPGAEISFVVGMDKLPQIFDAKYYDDVDESLTSLFARARLLVAARGDLEHRALRSMLELAPASRFAARIDWLDVDPRWRDVSAAEIRRRLRRGESVSAWLDPEVADFLRDHEVFGPLPSD